MEAEKAKGIPDDVFRGPIPYHAFLAIAADPFQHYALGRIMNGPFAGISIIRTSKYAGGQSMRSG